jgi:hypothetical protein
VESAVVVARIPTLLPTPRAQLRLPHQKVVINDISPAEFDAVCDHFRESRIAR